MFRHVNLRSNALSRLPRPALQISNLSSPPVFLLAPNPLLCDCSLEWLLPPGPGVLSVPGPHISDRDLLSCSPHPTGPAPLAPLPLAKLPPALLLCRYTQHCFSLCRCCTFLACDCRMRCPEHCACYHDQSWGLNMIQCSGRGLAEVPREVPMDSTVVFLDGNSLGLLAPEVFLGRNRVSVVHLNHSRITGLSNGSLAGLSSLTQLFLHHNLMSELSGKEFVEVPGLQVLHLHHNLLSAVSNSSFSQLTSLRELTLHDNLLSSLWLPPHLLSVSLRGNPWQCSCHLATTLERVQSSLSTVTCSRTPPGPPVSLQALSSSCKTRSVLAVSSPASTSTLLVLLVSVVLVVVLVVVLSTFLLLVRRPLSSWLASKRELHLRAKPVPEPLQYSAPSPGAREYSAYLHYCLADSEYVQQVEPKAQSVQYDPPPSTWLQVWSPPAPDVACVCTTGTSVRTPLWAGPWPGPCSRAGGVLPPSY